jgi:hypothetical protein
MSIKISSGNQIKNQNMKMTFSFFQIKFQLFGTGLWFGLLSAFYAGLEIMLFGRFKRCFFQIGSLVEPTMLLLPVGCHKNSYDYSSS